MCIAKEKQQNKKKQKRKYWPWIRIIFHIELFMKKIFREQSKQKKDW